MRDIYMPLASMPYTRREYELLPEGFPAQLIEGFFVRDPSPDWGHQGLVGRLHLALCAVVPSERVRVGPVDVPIDEFNVFVPDVAVYREALPEGGGYTKVPCAVFEVSSPSTSDRDRVTKGPRYLAAGVEEVWLLDRSRRCIELQARIGGSESTDAVVHSRAIPGFSIDPTTFFRRP